MGENIFDSLSKDEKEVLSIIQRRKGTETGKEDILRLSGFKSTTVNRILNKLKEEKLIVVSGEGQSTGGRKPLLYALNDRMGIYSLGINIALNHADFAVLHYTGRMVYADTLHIDKKMKPDYVLGLIEKMYRDSLRVPEIGSGKILTGGISVFAAVDSARERIISSNTEEFLNEEWIDFPLRLELEKRLLIPMIMDISTVAGCISEYVFGEGSNYDKISLFICRNIMRAGCIQNGMIIRSPENADDTFGHMVISVGGKRCFCGNYGCINRYASLEVIAEEFVSELKRGRHSILGDTDYDSLDGRAVLEAGEKGDSLATEVIERAATALGVGIANYIKLVNPDLIVMSGELVRSSHVYYETAKDTALRQLGYLKGRKKVVFKVRNGAEKASAGAAVMALETLLGHYY